MEFSLSKSNESKQMVMSVICDGLVLAEIQPTPTVRPTIGKWPPVPSPQTLLLGRSVQASNAVNTSFKVESITTYTGAHRTQLLENAAVPFGICIIHF